MRSVHLTFPILLVSPTPSPRHTQERPPHRSLAEKELLCKIFLHFKGSELIELKRLIDAAGGGHDLRHAVYSVITYEVRFLDFFQKKELHGRLQMTSPSFNNGMFLGVEKKWSCLKPPFTAFSPPSSGKGPALCSAEAFQRWSRKTGGISVAYFVGYRPDSGHRNLWCRPFCLFFFVCVKKLEGFSISDVLSVGGQPFMCVAVEKDIWKNTRANLWGNCRDCFLTKRSTFYVEKKTGQEQIMFLLGVSPTHDASDIIKIVHFYEGTKPSQTPLLVGRGYPQCIYNKFLSKKPQSPFLDPIALQTTLYSSLNSTKKKLIFPGVF